MPPPEHPLGFGEHRVSDALGVAAALRDLDEVANQVRPAELVLHGRPPVVGAVPVADEHAVGSAEDRTRRYGVAPRVDHEDRDRRCVNESSACLFRSSFRARCVMVGIAQRRDRDHGRRRFPRAAMIA